jgi:hypothetical protein
MDLPLRYDITIPQRATFRERVQIPLDCTDREVKAQVWEVRNGKRFTKLMDLQVVWVNRAVTIDVVVNGVATPTVYGDFWLVGSWQNTATVQRQGVWDLLVIDGPSLARAGERTYWLEGTALFNPGMTEA